MWAEEGLEFLSYRFANEALRGNEYPDGEATSVTLTGLTEGATYKVKARSRYSSGGRNNSRWSGPWSNEVTASVSVAAPVAQEPGDEQQQQVDDPQTQGDDQQGQRDDSSVVSGESVEADETVSEDRASRSEPAGDDLSAGTDTVGAVAADSAARGTISEGFSLWDADWFAAELVAGSTYVIEVLGAGAGADCTLRGPVLERVHDVDGTPVVGTETWDDGRDSLTKLTFTPASPGTHFISVAGEANAAGHRHLHLGAHRRRPPQQRACRRHRRRGLRSHSTRQQRHRPRNPPAPPPTRPHPKRPPSHPPKTTASPRDQTTTPSSGSPPTSSGFLLIRTFRAPGLTRRSRRDRPHPASSDTC